MPFSSRASVPLLVNCICINIIDVRKTGNRTRPYGFAMPLPDLVEEDVGCNLMPGDL